MIVQENFEAYETAPIKYDLTNWVKQIANQCEAEKIHWCDGSKEE
jgi:GTP-dependent phosphoenolpyruvate carboxykinase